MTVTTLSGAPEALKSNPLVNPPKLPHGAPPLDALKVEHYLPAVHYGVETARNDVEIIKRNPAPADFANTIEALELAGALLSRVATVFGNIAGNNANDEIRAIEEEIDVAVVKYSNDVMMDSALFDRVKAVYIKRDALDLSLEETMLLDETYKRFARSGADLPEAAKDELRKINERLAALATTFKNNVVKATDAYGRVVKDEAELKGLPERTKALYRSYAEEKGNKGEWLIKLSPPPIDILEYCENRGLREEIQKARLETAYGGEFDNRPVILEMVGLKHRQAQLLGFKDYASFVLDDRMAKTSAAVLEFLDKNEAVYRPAAEKYLQKVKDYAQKLDKLPELKPWDFLYYSRLLKEETFTLNLEELRPYFDLEKVMDGILTHAKKLFGIDMVVTKGKYPVYHEDVKVYEVKDTKSGEMIGLFYADFYARPGAKNNGAWMSTFRNRGISGESGRNEFSIVTNTCNFAKPTAEHPTLLSIDEVRTVFHEFGHALHALLAKGDYSSITGTNVKWDFVELPSQLQENWAKEKEVLDTFARHNKTGEALPADVIQKINEMENFDAGYAGLRQTFFGRLDMVWHTTDPKDIRSVESLEDSVIATTWVFKREGGAQSTSFGHLFGGGYAAGYYSYKWAEALEADVFSEFTGKGLYHADAAQRLRDTIYAQGGTDDPMNIFVKMMGRKPDPSALFRREGLLEEAARASRKAG
ncbi:MAG: M3 family metallopeptidase [Alphaproteobacteria bacterium]